MAIPKVSELRPGEGRVYPRFLVVFSILHGNWGSRHLGLPNLPSVFWSLKCLANWKHQVTCEWKELWPTLAQVIAWTVHPASWQTGCKSHLPRLQENATTSSHTRPHGFQPGCNNPVHVSTHVFGKCPDSWLYLLCCDKDFLKPLTYQNMESWVTEIWLFLVMVTTNGSRKKSVSYSLWLEKCVFFLKFGIYIWLDKSRSMKDTHAYVYVLCAYLSVCI